MPPLKVSKEKKRHGAPEGSPDNGFPSCPGIALVFPDTSPRGAKIEDEDKDWDFGKFPPFRAVSSLSRGGGPLYANDPSPDAGTGAGFYINATKEPWNKHYNM